MASPAWPGASLVLLGRWRKLQWAAPLLAVAMTGEVASGGANGWETRPAAILVNLLITGAILLTAEAPSRVWIRMRSPFMLLVAGLLWATLPRLLPSDVMALLGVPADPAPDRLWPELAEAISRLALLMAACVTAYRQRTVRPFVISFAAAGALYVGWMIVTPAPWLFLAGIGHGRFAATVGNWNAAGVYFGMITVLCLAWLLAHGGPRRSGWHWLLGLPFVAALLLCMATQSRSAFTLTAMALSINMVWHATKRQALLLLVLIPLVVMLLAYLGASALFPRYLALSADGLSRWDIVTTYFGYTLDSPLWGFGPGSFFEVNQARLTTVTAVRFWNLGAAHNAALQIALEAGWPALLLLVAGVIGISRDIARRSWDAEDMGLIGALGIVAGASMVDIAWNVPAIGAFSCVLLGALWGARPAHASTLQLRRRNSTGRARGVPVTS